MGKHTWIILALAGLYLYSKSTQANNPQTATATAFQDIATGAANSAQSLAGAFASLGLTGLD